MTLLEAREVARLLAARTDPTTGKPLALDNRTVEACRILAECASLAHKGLLYIGKHLRADKATLALLQPAAPPPTPAPTVPRKAGAKWTPEEEQKLLARFDRGTPLSLLAKEHDRSLIAICERLQKLGRTLPSGQVPAGYQPMAALPTTATALKA
jgi:hypothetical protein